MNSWILVKNRGKQGGTFWDWYEPRELFTTRTQCYKLKKLYVFVLISHHICTRTLHFHFVYVVVSNFLFCTTSVSEYRKSSKCIYYFLPREWHLAKFVIRIRMSWWISCIDIKRKREIGILSCSYRGGTTDYKETKLLQNGRKWKGRCLFMFTVT